MMDIINPSPEEIQALSNFETLETTVATYAEVLNITKSSINDAGVKLLNELSILDRFRLLYLAGKPGTPYESLLVGKLQSFLGKSAFVYLFRKAAFQSESDVTIFYTKVLNSLSYSIISRDGILNRFDNDSRTHLSNRLRIATHGQLYNFAKGVVDSLIIPCSIIYPPGTDSFLRSTDIPDPNEIELMRSGLMSGEKMADITRPYLQSTFLVLQGIRFCFVEQGNVLNPGASDCLSVMARSERGITTLHAALDSR